MFIARCSTSVAVSTTCAFAPFDAHSSAVRVCAWEAVAAAASTSTTTTRSEARRERWSRPCLCASQQRSPACCSRSMASVRLLAGVLVVLQQCNCNGSHLTSLKRYDACNSLPCWRRRSLRARPREQHRDGDHRLRDAYSRAPRTRDGVAGPPREPRWRVQPPPVRLASAHSRSHCHDACTTSRSSISPLRLAIHTHTALSNAASRRVHRRRRRQLRRPSACSCTSTSATSSLHGYVRPFTPTHANTSRSSLEPSASLSLHRVAL